VADCLLRSFDDPAIAAEAVTAAVLYTDASVSENDLSDQDSDDRVIATIFGSLGTAVITLPAVDVATAADDPLSRVRNFIVDGWPTTKRTVPANLFTYYALQEELSTAFNGQCIVRGSRK
jgi:hypothetical protein